MSEDSESLGIIAGSKSLPIIVAKSARAAGIRRLVAVGFEGETDPALASQVDDMVWLRVGQLVKLIDAFRTRSVRRCVMAGQIAPKNLFDLRPDFRALSLLLKLKERNARTIFGTIAGELEKDGIQLIEATPWLRPIMPGPGYVVGPKLTPAQGDDIAFGRRVADQIAGLEIGQTVVVKNGTVLAVEAFEGTDACLRRGGELAGPEGGAVAVKVASPTHDFRFDVPCLGPRTLDVCREARLAVLAFQSGKTLLLDRDETEQLAVRYKISLTSVA
jgi:DUF1009 family protein